VGDRHQTISDKRFLGILCCIVIVGVLICTWWPFNPFPSNQVSWLPEADGIRFGAHGVVLSKGPVVSEATDVTQSSGLELLLQPAEVERAYTILSFYALDNPRQFRVRQWTDGLLVSQGVLDIRGKVKTKKFDVNHAFQRGRLLFLTLTSGPSGTVVYLNGRQTQVFSNFIISQSDLSGQIVLGTSAVGYQPWPGEIHGLALYSRQLTSTEVLQHYENWMARGVTPPDIDGAIAFYKFAERTGNEIHNSVASGPDLEIPGIFRVDHKPFLESPVKEFKASWSYLGDLLSNIAGFVPVGFLLCACLRAARSGKPAILYATFCGGLLSLIIEVVQFYIPPRGSGTTDIITNTIGSAIGAGLASPNLVGIILRGKDYFTHCEEQVA
jgi:VanZ family protein